MNKTKTAILTALMLICLPLSFVGAQNSAVLETPNLPGSSPKNALVTCDGSKEKPCGYVQFVGVAQNILNLMFALAAFILAGMFMYAGFLLITSAGDVAQITKAKGVFRRVLIGFLIMFLSFLLVKELLNRLLLSDPAKKILEKIIKL